MATRTTAAAQHDHELEDSLREKSRRDAIDAAHFFGLAALYEERGKRAQAAEPTDASSGSTPAMPAISQ